MLRNCTKLPSQFSVSLGKAFDETYSAKLEKHGFPSKYWINEKNLQKIGVALKPNMKGVETKSGALFNAAQTADAKKVESFYGRLTPTFALSHYIIKSTMGKVMAPSGPNEWLTTQQIEKLGLTLKPGSTATRIMVNDKQVDIHYMDQIKEKDALRKALALQHMPLGSPVVYAGDYINHLVRETMQKGFTTGLWVTPGRLQKLGLDLKPKQKPVAIPHKDKTVELYNAEQTIDASRLERIHAKQTRAQYMVTSGKRLPNTIGELLAAEMEKNPGWVNMWMSYGNAKKSMLIRMGEYCASIIPEGGVKQFYVNAAVLKNKEQLMRKCQQLIRANMSEKYQQRMAK